MMAMEKKHFACPYCDKEIMEADFPFCQACRLTVFYCPQCRQPLPRENRVCPACGAEIKAGENQEQG